jgi:imidazolonepropionase-like amidohydrolase
VLSRIGYGLATALVAALALACLVWSLLVPPPYPMPPRGVVVIKDVTIVNPGLGRSAHVDITLRGGLITAIAPTAPTPERNELRCDGCYVLPGLIDMDARGPDRASLGADRAAALEALRQGVTLVRDLGGVGDGLFRLRDRIQEGRLPGPRIVTCGGVIYGGSVDRARRIAGYAIRRGARCLAAGPGLNAPALRALADEATQARIPLVAARPRDATLANAPFIADGVGLAADCDTSSEGQVQDLVEAAVAQHTAHTPLLSAPAPPSRPACAGPRGLETVKALFHAGAPVYAASGGPLKSSADGLKRELSAYVGLGLTPDQALVTATTSAGRFWPDATYGQVAIGLPADLGLYRRDPTLSLANLDSLDTVVADGRVYPKSQLDAWAARCRDHFKGWFYQLFAPYVGG